MKIMKTVQKFPGGLMVIPLLLACVINTVAPQLLQIGGFTSGLLSSAGVKTFVGLFLFVSGATINIKQVGVPVYKGAVLTVSKVGIGLALGILLGKIFGPWGVLGITPLAVMAALANCNSVMYAILAGQVGDSTDVGAVSVLGLDDGPFFTMMALGAAGMATIPFMDMVAVVVPLILGLILGNLDEEIRDLCEKGTPLVIPFNGFVLGAGMNLRDVVKAGVPGVILGLVSLIVTGFFCYWVYNLFFGRKRKTAVGFGVGNTAGNAVVTPNAIGQSDPSWAPYAAGATAQVAAACVVTSILCPLITTYLHKRIQKKYGEVPPQVAAK
ncbi:2-keto-3-deoxygluconate permease [Desulfitobacterium sp. THU1]|uniref:2-keto-3-deoxygluconate permease n=1 Tax=Desulfitobacterium sp. THU1 TaxID=3138072 RepID=UPI00311F8EFC